MTYCIVVGEFVEKVVLLVRQTFVGSGKPDPGLLTVARPTLLFFRQLPLPDPYPLECSLVEARIPGLAASRVCQEVVTSGPTTLPVLAGGSGLPSTWKIAYHLPDRSRLTMTPFTSPLIFRWSLMGASPFSSLKPD